MGKASSAKKVARAARAGGNRRAGQRRQMGFPVAVALVLVFGLLLVFIARERRNADAFPKANQDHVHASIDIYTCVTADEASAAASTTTTESTTTTTTEAPSTSSGETTTTTAPTTTTTAPTTSTTQLAPTDVHGEYQPAPTDATQDDPLGIHTHGDGLMHIHPFKDSVAGRNATFGVFLDKVGISMTNNVLTLGTGKSFTEGTTKCEDGKDAVIQVAKWDHADEAARGNKPNQIFTDGFDKIRLGANESFVIAFVPEGSTIKAKPDVQDRISKVTDVAPTNASGSTNSAPPTSLNVTPLSGITPASGDQGSSTTATTAPTTASSTSSSGP